MLPSVRPKAIAPDGLKGVGRLSPGDRNPPYLLDSPQCQRVGVHMTIVLQTVVMGYLHLSYAV